MGDLGSNPGMGKSSGEGKGYPTPVFWPGEFHGLYSPWGLKECDMAEQPSLSLSLKAEFETCALRSGCSSGNNNTGGMKQGRKGNTDQGWASDSV